MAIPALILTVACHAAVATANPESLRQAELAYPPEDCCRPGMPLTRPMPEGLQRV